VAVYIEIATTIQRYLAATRNAYNWNRKQLQNFNPLCL